MITPEQQAALSVARELVRAGVPVFLARPDDTHPTGYRLPKVWDHFTAQPNALDAWTPELAVVAVTGCGLDLVDIDPRSGGALDSIRASGVTMPEGYLMAETPSGGTHYFVKSIGVPSLDGVFPGIDLKSGAPDGSGRGLAFLAPTVRRSKVNGVRSEYRWMGDVSSFHLDTNETSRFSRDNSGAELAQHVYTRRGGRVAAEQPRRVARSAAAREFDSAWNKLVTNLRLWSSTNWGGEAHAGLLAATTFLARIAPDHAEHAFREAFRAADLEPDAADLVKLESALQRVVPDVVVPDEDMSPSGRFLSGGDSPLGLTSHLGELSGAAAGVETAAVSGVEGEQLTYGVAAELQRLRDRARARELFDLETSGAASSALTAMSFAELQLLAPPTPLIAGLLDRGTYAVMPGQFGSFKTFTALSWAFAVALGKPWGEHEVPEALPVLYVAAEGAAGVMRRLDALARHHGVAVPSTLRVVPRVADLGSDGVVERLGEIAAGMGAALLVTDTLHQCTPGLDENSNTDMGAVLGRMRRRVIEPLGVTWLAPHHTGHEVARSRGASCIEDDADTVLLATVKGGNEAARSLTTPRFLEVRKSKDGESGKKITLCPTVVGDSLVVEPQAAKRRTAAFWGDESDVRVGAVVAKLQAHERDGASWAPTLRATVAMLRDLGETGDDQAVLRPAARRFLAEKGFTQMADPA